LTAFSEDDLYDVSWFFESQEMEYEYSKLTKPENLFKFDWPKPRNYEFIE